MRNHLPRALALVLFVIMAASCASGGGPGDAAAGAAGEGVALRVHNTDTSGQRLAIFLVPQVGEMKRLGVVDPDETLTVSHADGQGRFQFRAERPDGTTVTSPSFNVVSGTYTWDMALRRVDRSR